MKKRLIGFLLATILFSICVGCGAKSTTTEQTEQATATTTEESISEQTEDTTTAPEEVIEPTPEVTEYPSEEAVAEPEEAVPEQTEPPTAEPVPQYTYTDMSATMYAQQTVNVRNLPDTNGNKLGSLSINDEVVITGQCNETSWYRIDYNNQIGFVSDKYLSGEKIETVEKTTVTQPQTINENLEPFPYPLYTWEKQLSDQGLYFYRIYTPYSKYRDVVDLNWNGQTNFNLFEDGNYDVIDTLSYNWPPNTGYHTVFEITKIGDYKEGTDFSVPFCIPYEF